MAHVNPSLIDKAASNVVSAPLAYLELAHRYLEDACKAHIMAFGVIGTPYLQVQYEHTRSLHSGNLQAGCDKLNEMANGLAYVAAHWRAAERANTFTKPAGVTPDLPYVPPTGSSNLGNVVEFAGLYFSWSLAAVRLAEAAVLTACGAMAPPAMIGFAAWGLWTPDDARLSEVQAGWSMAADKVDAAREELVTALKPLDDGWRDSADREAFDAWLPSLLTELGQTASDLRKVAERLGKIHDDLNAVQMRLFIFSAACFALIIFYSAAENAPYVGPIFKVLKYIQGIVLGFGVIGALSEVAALLAASLLMAPAPVKPGLPGLSMNADNKGVGLADLSITWDDSYQAQFT